VTLCGWEGNRRSGVALANAMRHRLSGLSTYGLNGLDREMSLGSLRSGGARPALPYLIIRL